jgi:hypothetical protein
MSTILLFLILLACPALLEDIGRFGLSLLLITAGFVVILLIVAAAVAGEHWLKGHTPQGVLDIWLGIIMLLWVAATGAVVRRTVKEVRNKKYGPALFVGGVAAAMITVFLSNSPWSEQSITPIMGMLSAVMLLGWLLLVVTYEIVDLVRPARSVHKADR